MITKGQKRKFVPVERNYDGVQFGELRQQIEKPYNDEHDLLTKCFIEEMPYRNYGTIDALDEDGSPILDEDGKQVKLLSKEEFEQLHGLIFHCLSVRFHEENMKRSEDERYDEDSYRFVYNDGNVVADNVELAKKAIAEAKKLKFEHKHL
jgi:hypothetical protein